MFMTIRAAHEVEEEQPQALPWRPVKLLLQCQQNDGAPLPVRQSSFMP